MGVIKIIKPGLYTTVQDKGRMGFQIYLLVTTKMKR